MTMDDTDEEDTGNGYPSMRLTAWLVLSFIFNFWRNIFNAFTLFYEEMTEALVAHGNWKNDRKTFSDSVLADLTKL